MKMMMMKCLIALLAALSFTAVAGAQDFPNEPYEFLIAKLAAAQGNYDEALLQIDKVIKAKPDDPVLLYERALMLVESGRVDRAERELRAVVEKHPGFYDANRVLGRILLDRAGNDRDRVEEALGFLQAAFKANPDDISTGVVVSQILNSLDRTEDAEKVLATMLERAPDQRGLNYNYAQVLTKLGRGSESKQYLERAVAIDPTFSPAINQLLEIYQQENEWAKAAEILAPLIAEDPMNLDLQKQQAFYYLRAGDARNARDRFKILAASDPKDSHTEFYLAESLNDLEQFGEAEPILRRLVAEDPSDVEYRTSLAMNLTGQKRWNEASKELNVLLGMSDVPDNLQALAHTQLAYIDLERDDYAAALEAAKTVLVYHDKPNPQAINIALESLKKQKKFTDAVALIEPLAQKFDSDPFVNSRYVEMLVRAGRKQKASERAALQAKIGPRNATAVAEAYVQTEDYAGAIDLVKSAIAAKPDDIDLEFELGSIYERSGDRKTAETTFLDLLAKKPDHAPSLNYLGYMWAEQGENLDRAHEMLTRAVGQEPNNGAYVDSLGWVYFRLGKLDLAEKYLSDAAQLMPRDATVQEHLADVLAKRGQTARAVALYRSAIELDPESKDVEKLRSKIAEIESHSQTTQR